MPKRSDFRQRDITPKMNNIANAATTPAPDLKNALLNMEKVENREEGGESSAWPLCSGLPLSAADAARPCM